MAFVRYNHILRFLHFMDNNSNRVDRTDDRLWKIWDLFEIIRINFSKFYNPSEHLAVDEVIVKFMGRVLFKQFIPKKSKRFSIKMLKLAAITRKAYVVCSAGRVKRTVIFRRVKCDVALVLTETAFRIIRQRPTYKTSFQQSSVQTVESLTTM
jgi:hypothetical protein